MGCEEACEGNMKLQSTLGNAVACQHVLLDCSGCDPSRLDSVDHLMAMLSEIAQECSAQVIGKGSHKFEPYGVTAFLLLAESHVSVHSWPELGYAAVDAFSCKAFDAAAVEVIVGKRLHAEVVGSRVVLRGGK